MIIHVHLPQIIIGIIIMRSMIMPRPVLLPPVRIVEKDLETLDIIIIMTGKSWSKVLVTR